MSNGVPTKYELRMSGPETWKSGPETWILRPGGVGLVRPNMRLNEACSETVRELNALLERAEEAEAELAGWRALQRAEADPKLVDRFDKFMLDALGTAGAQGEPATKCRDMFVAVVGVAQKAAADAYARAAKPEIEEEALVLSDLADSILAVARETFGEDRVNRNPRPHFWLGALCARAEADAFAKTESKP